MEDGIDKSLFKDELGRYLTQSLFLENKYDVDTAVFTFSGEDKVHKGKEFLSLKRLYLEEGDPEEYVFATKYLYDWPHWKKMTKNKIIKAYVDEWREELALSLRAEGIATMVDLAVNKGSYQAAKYLSDKGWENKVRGRPSKDDIKKEMNLATQVEKEYEADMSLLNKHKGIK